MARDKQKEIIKPVKASPTLMHDLRQIIEQARRRAATAVNSELTLMNWHIGERINRDILKNRRAEYGKQIVAEVAKQLQMEYGNRGFDVKSIRRMMQFANLFPDITIVAPLVRQLSWTHFLLVLPLKDELQREFYLTMAAAEKWSKRALQSKVDGMLYERTAISSKPNEFIKKELANLRNDSEVSPDLVFLYQNGGIVNRLLNLESKDMEQDARLLEHDHKFDTIFEAMDRGELH